MPPDTVHPLLAVTVLATGLTACAPAPERPTYITGSVCAECHADEYDQWTGSHHDLAMQVASDETVLGNFADAEFEYFGRSTSFHRREDDFIVRTEGPDGLVGDYRVAYTFGVSPLQQYLVELPGGRLQALGVAWDTRARSEGGQCWYHLYPDQDVHAGHPLHWTSRSQNWNSGCADCHSTGFEKNYDPGGDRYGTAWSDPDVSCEACHGPGAAHVAWARGRGWGRGRTKDGMGLVIALDRSKQPRWTLDDGARTARRVGAGNGAAELGACAPCHSRRRALVDGRHAGTPFLDAYRPALLDRDLYYADGQMQGEVYVYGSFVQSLMYQRGVTCSDCHDPHSARVRAPGNELCTACHATSAYDGPQHHFHPPESPGARCVECHMPARTYMGVDARRDHSLRIPRPDLSDRFGSPDACTSCHTDRSAVWAARAIAARYGPDRPAHFGLALLRGRRGGPATDSVLARLVSDTTKPAIARATGLSLLGRYPGSLLRRAVAEAVRDPEPLVRLAAALAVEPLDPATRYSLVGPLLADSVGAVRTEVARVLAPMARAPLVGEEAAALNAALERFVAAELVHADRPDAHLNIGLVQLYGGRLDQAEGSFRRAVELDAAFVPGYVNLADLRRLQGRDAEGRELLDTALTVDPENATAHHALGLLLVREGNRQGAISALERAARLDPNQTRYAYVYAISLHSTGRSASAVRVLEEALRRHPFALDLLSGLVGVHRDRGDLNKALRIARRLAAAAPYVPEYQTLVAQISAARDAGRR